jgi:hypothetical protein
MLFSEDFGINSNVSIKCNISISNISTKFSNIFGFRGIQISISIYTLK